MLHRALWRNHTIAMLALVLACAASVTFATEISTPCCADNRAADQVWHVSIRGLGCDVEAEAHNLEYRRYDGAGWQTSSLEELLAADDGTLITTVFVHGNRSDADDAFESGWRAYRTLVRCAGDRPLRFVIWSWPSERVCGPVRDAREKAARTNPAGYYLAWFVDRLNPQATVSLWGHSFGARIVTGALHILGGGEINGHQLSERASAERLPINAVLMAAALDNHWLAPGHFHGRALGPVGEMLLVNNSCDALLKRYRVIYHRRSCAQAMGYTGVAGGLAAEDRAKIEQVDACCQIGRIHSLQSYLSQANLVSRMRDVLLFMDASTDTTAEPVASPELPTPEAASEKSKSEERVDAEPAAEVELTISE